MDSKLMNISKHIDKIIFMVFAGLFLTACQSKNDDSTKLFSGITSYQFVVDAGSSGSRIHVYKIVYHNNDLPVITDVGRQDIKLPLENKLPLSNATTAEAVSVAVKPLLDNAIAQMKSISPRTHLATIRTSVLGTAGMRYTEDNSPTIYKYVADLIKSEGLKLGDTKTITGHQEGLYSWADVNYLKGNFARDDASTVGIIEIGGASAQVAFVTEDYGVDENIKPNLEPVRIANHNFAVYAVSFLGLGQDKARDAINTVNSVHDFNSCYPTGYKDDKSGIVGFFNFKDCDDLYNTVKSKADFADLVNIHTIRGFDQTKFIGLSSVYYSTNFWGVDNTPNKNSLNAKVQNDCSDWTNMQKNHDSQAYKPFNQCANTTYIVGVLYDSLQLKEQQIIALTSINSTDLNWTLGYVLLTQ